MENETFNLSSMLGENGRCSTNYFLIYDDLIIRKSYMSAEWEWEADEQSWNLEREKMVAGRVRVWTSCDIGDKSKRIEPSHWSTLSCHYCCLPNPIWERYCHLNVRSHWSINGNPVPSFPFIYLKMYRTNHWKSQASNAMVWIRKTWY